MPQRVDWVAAAKTVARAYIDYSYTLRSGLSLDYELTVRWTVNSLAFKEVMFRSDLDGLCYLVRVEKTGTGEHDMQCVVKEVYEE